MNVIRVLLEDGRDAWTQGTYIVSDVLGLLFFLVGLAAIVIAEEAGRDCFGKVGNGHRRWNCV